MTAFAVTNERRASFRISFFDSWTVSALDEAWTIATKRSMSMGEDAFFMRRL